jgi:hypothetical protein
MFSQTKKSKINKKIVSNNQELAKSLFLSYNTSITSHQNAPHPAIKMIVITQAHAPCNLHSHFNNPRIICNPMTQSAPAMKIYHLSVTYNFLFIYYNYL